MRTCTQRSLPPRTSTHTSTRTLTHICSHMSTHRSTHRCRYTHVYTCPCTCLCICPCTCPHTCPCTCVEPWQSAVEKPASGILVWRRSLRKPEMSNGGQTKMSSNLGREERAKKSVDRQLAHHHPVCGHVCGNVRGHVCMDMCAWTCVCV